MVEQTASGTEELDKNKILEMLYFSVILCKG
jgi:hypothetical protein